ncbi:hypothetical protein [Agromyces sp. NPDC058126]|uniref:ATP-binding protein n=1 Tax=Agromyces sp. NPDC058126 TaxID=3346350 RepID=UPI0036DD8F54
MTNAPLVVRGLKLVGPVRSYRVDFNESPDASARSLAIIAGEISTGKTTILEFIDWCLGAKAHPEHDEVLTNVRSAQLAVEVQDSEIGGDGRSGRAQYVIERPLGGPTTKAWLYAGDLDSMSDRPLRSLEADPADNDSVSQYLLQLCGLAGVRLRSAPTKEDSATSILSFRDLQPLWYLQNRRMDNANLAFERDPHRSIKLVQVVDLIFGVSDDTSSALARQVEELAAEERELRRALETLKRFLADAGFQSIEGIDETSDKVRAELVRLSAELAGVDARLAASTQFAETLRIEYRRQLDRARALESDIRDRETLAKRLDPLRSQYADELRKLELADESMSLFDSLHIVTCPVCQNPLDPTPTIRNGQCTLCHSAVEASVGESKGSTGIDKSEHTDSASRSFDLSVERSSLKRRLNQLKGFASDVRAESDGMRGQLRATQADVERARHELDLATRETLAPFMAERDVLAMRSGSARAELDSLAQSRGMMAQLRQKETELQRVDASLKAAKDRKRAHAATFTSRDGVLARLGARIDLILRDFGYPKVAMVRVDNALVPHVRGKRYDKVGSSGAMTLIALAWELAIFELATEEGAGHPGFLLIDSPQKNLRPARSSARRSEDEALTNEIGRNHASIVHNIYGHILRWLEKYPESQIIVVDNEPPESVAHAEVVRYSGDPNDPPYGLIDNEDGRALERPM